MARRLDDKIARIRSGDYKPSDFIIADAKDPDMAFGCTAAGKSPDGRFKPVRALYDDMERVVRSDLADIMLMSHSSAEVMHDRMLFENSAATPAVRLNDASDIWFARGSSYRDKPAMPFRSVRLDLARRVADLGLYAITFYNDLTADHRTLEEYARFREQASQVGMRHFLEVFNPHFEVETPGSDFASFNNDSIVRCLAGLSRQERPMFLKIAYNGPRAMEELASYDPGSLICGILGGGAGTTRDCLELLSQAEKYGARIALFGRKIYHSENSILMITAMRRVIEEGLSSAEGTKAYHADLVKAGTKPLRDLADDLELSEPILKQHAETGR